MKNTIYLISLSSTNKIRCAEISFTASNNSGVIHRTTWQYLKKRVCHEDISITSGKSNRTIQQQAELEYNHIVKTYKDKGYKEIDSDPDGKSESELFSIIGFVKTDTTGFGKHMLAKQVSQVKPEVVENVACWYASRKIDGLRNSFYLNNNTIKSASRGGGNYDAATEHIRTNSKFIEFFQKHPDVIFDGELFVMGKSLQQLSGEARREDGTHKFLLEYWIYDIMEDKPFSDRLADLQQYETELSDLGFIHFVEQVKIEGNNKLDQIWKLHDKWVSEGWEGAVIRDASKTYKNGARGNLMLKFKRYNDAEFKVIGYELGLRGSEDMVFRCEMKNGTQFLAKPFGSKEVKEEYVQNFYSRYKDQMATVKYFYLSDTGVPLQPSLKCFRLKEDLN